MFIKTDKIVDTLIRLKNNYSKNKKTVKILNLKKNRKLLNLLYREGYIIGYSAETNSKFINVTLKYTNLEPGIKEINIFSKPSKKIFLNLSKLSKIKNDDKLVIISTVIGYKSLYSAIKQKQGGELICSIN